jgi:hypothetical protein
MGIYVFKLGCWGEPEVRDRRGRWGRTSYPGVGGKVSVLTWDRGLEVCARGSVVPAGRGGALQRRTCLNSGDVA